LAAESVLVLGATGGFGGAMARELAMRGHRVRILARDPAAAADALSDFPDFQITAGDVQDAAGLAREAEGASVIVHGVNYPYHQWVPYMVRATANVAAAARRTRATILFPGNVYGLGEQTGCPLDEQAPMRATTRKGALRTNLETSLRATVGDGVQVIVLRANDYFGPTVRNPLVDRMFGNAAIGRAIMVLGNVDAAHQWAYLPDAARAGAMLLERRAQLDDFDVFHFAGHLADPQRDFLGRIAALAGHPGLSIRQAPWWLIQMRGWFDPVAREVLELRYLWDNAVILDGTRLARILPEFMPTPLDEAISATIASYRRM
jgi:nucleoside-diphosphate-sugar epimerase